MVDVSGMVSSAAPELITRPHSYAFPAIILWIIGMIGLALFFFITHFRCRREYEGAVPLENDYVNKWLREQKLWRTVKVCISDRITAPMTYGICKPIILFPLSTNFQDKFLLKCVLTHELTHIRRFDILSKWLLAAALCIHWFNPLVWVMYILANRDIEYACDEKVVWTFGGTIKSAYALMLIKLVERSSKFSPLYNNFARSAINERIRMIMKIKKMSAMRVMMAALLVSIMAVGAFVVNAQAPYESRGFNEPYVHYYPIFVSMPEAPVQPFLLTDDGEIYVHYYPITTALHDYSAKLTGYIMHYGVSDVLLERLDDYGARMWIGTEGMTDEEIGISLMSMLDIHCRICGSRPVWLLRTATGQWRFTGTRVRNADGTYSFQYQRFIDRYYRGSCNYHGRSTVVQTQWFNSFNRP